MNSITVHYQVFGLRRSTLHNNTTKGSLEKLDNRLHRMSGWYRDFAMEYLTSKHIEAEITFDHRPRKGKPLTKPEIWADDGELVREALWAAHRYAMMEIAALRSEPVAPTITAAMTAVKTWLESGDHSYLNLQRLEERYEANTREIDKLMAALGIPYTPHDVGVPDMVTIPERWYEVTQSRLELI